MRAFAVNALCIAHTRQDLIAPEVEARFIRFATEEIEIVLPDEILRRIERVDRAAGRRRAKGCFGRGALLAKGNHGRREGVVHPRRRDSVEAAGFHVVEAVVTIRIRDELAVLGAT